MVPVSSTLYDIGPGEFSGLTYTLHHVDSLNNPKNLQPNYFLSIKDRGHYPHSFNDIGAWKPSAHIIRATSDPFGTGELGITASGNQITFTREVATGDWTGTIEIIECYDGTDPDGFKLLDVKDITWGASVSAVSSTEVSAWTNIDNVVCYNAGSNIASSNDFRDRAVGLGTRVFAFDDGGVPRLDLQRNLIRSNGNSTTCTQYDTEYIVEYNSGYTVQSVDLNILSCASYPSWDTTSVSSVTRKHTMVHSRLWCEGGNDAGWTYLDRPVVLGNGVDYNAQETEIATTLYLSGLGTQGKIYLISNPNLNVSMFSYGNSLGAGVISSTEEISIGGSESYRTDGNISKVHGSRSFNIRNVLHGDDLVNAKSFPTQLVTVVPTSSSSISLDRLYGSIGSYPEGEITYTTVQDIDWEGITGGNSDNLSTLNSSASVDRSNYVPASTEELVTLTVTVKDASGILVDGVLVEVSTDRGSLDNELIYTNSLGVATFTLSSSSVGVATLSIKVYQETSGFITLGPVSVTFIKLPLNYEGRVALNINSVNDFAEEQPFIDMFKAARHGSVSIDGGSEFHVSSLEDYDSSGYQMTCAIGQTLNYTLRTNATGGYASGTFVLTYSGGDFTTDKPSEIGMAGATEITNVDGKITFDWDASSNLFFQIDPATSGMTSSNYVHSITCLPIEEVSSYNHSVQPFRTKFMDSLEGVNLLRYMSFVDTNNNSVSAWEDRAKVTDANTGTFLYDPDYSPTTRRSKGVPWEYAIEMSNQVSSDVWLNVPQRATDSYVSSLAILMRDTLDSELRVFVEYTNESWNSIFTADNYMTDVLVPQYGITPGGVAWLQAYATRSCEVFEIFRDIFSEQPHRVKSVIAGQSTNPSRVNDLLKTDVSIGTSLSGIAANYTDYYAIAPYIGASVEESDAVSAFNALEAQLPIVFSSNGDVSQNVANVKAIDSTIGILGYEGGQHLTTQGVQTTSVVTDANRNPKQRELHYNYMQSWDSLTNNSVMAIFSHLWQPGDSGAWGLLESLDYYGKAPYTVLPSEGNYKWWGWNDWRYTLVEHLQPKNDSFSVRKIGSLLARTPMGIKG